MGFVLRGWHVGMGVNCMIIIRVFVQGGPGWVGQRISIYSDEVMMIFSLQVNTRVYTM